MDWDMGTLILGPLPLESLVTTGTMFAVCSSKTPLKGGSERYISASQRARLTSSAESSTGPRQGTRAAGNNRTCIRSTPR